jgi:hypothetical protein
MFIHFAFGALGREGEIQEQTKVVIDCILKEKRLKANKCEEFIPIFPDQNSKPIPLKPFKAVEGRTDLVVAKIDRERIVDIDNIRYLPEDVPMICFIKIAFSQLKNSMLHKEYGKLGIVLTNDFLRARGIKPVHYYTEESLWNDQLIKKWNYDAEGLNKGEKSKLAKEIVSFRKPAKLFPSFRKSVTHIIQFGSGKPQTSYFTYNRYAEGYDFTKENEYRIVFDEGNEYLHFKEDDLYMIIAPNLEAQKTIETFLNENWRAKPKVKVYPPQKRGV